MKNNAKERKYVSERQRIYYEQIAPKLDQQVLELDLGMRINTCLVNAEIFSVNGLKQALKEKRHINMLGKDEIEEIEWKLRVKEFGNK